MAADNELPVWTIRPNWHEGIIESLAWLTDVLESNNGTEQARALRLSPRRSFEMIFNPVEADRSYFDLWLHRFGATEFMMPLFHDQARITEVVGIGDGTIPFDNTFREFAVGGMAILIGETPHEYDAVEITAMTDAGITVTGAEVTHAWPIGSRIYPLRRARLDAESMFSALTSHVGQATLRIDLNVANDLPDEGVWGGLEYLDLPVMTVKPNRREALDTSYIRKLLTLDNEHGLRYLVDDAERAFTVQMHNWSMRGREEHWAFRQMLYRLRGRSQAVWLPTFNRDLILSQDADAADTALDIKNIGYEYTGEVMSGRDHILIGATPLAISSVGTPATPAEERLNLSGAVGADFPAGASACFLEVCRLDQDSVEITHYTDTDGVSESKTAFRSFLNERTAEEPIYYPIPIAAQSDESCGTPDSDTCLGIPESVDWYFKLRYVVIDPGPSTGNGQCNVSTTPSFGAGAVGIFLDENSRPVSQGYINSAEELIIEYTYYLPVPTGGDWTMSTQHGSGTVPSYTRGKFQYMRPEDAGWTDIICTSGYGTTPGVAIFDIQGLWPNTRHWTLAT